MGDQSLFRLQMARDYVLPSGASLKLSILNPRGRIWTMVAGGGKHTSNVVSATNRDT